MASVTARIKEVKQPRGGYIKPSQFEQIVYDDGIKFEKKIYTHPLLVWL